MSTIVVIRSTRPLTTWFKTSPALTNVLGNQSHWVKFVLVFSTAFPRELISVLWRNEFTHICFCNGALICFPRKGWGGKQKNCYPNPAGFTRSYWELVNLVKLCCKKARYYKLLRAYIHKPFSITDVFQDYLYVWWEMRLRLLAGWSNIIGSCKNIVSGPSRVFLKG